VHNIKYVHAIAQALTSSFSCVARAARLLKISTIDARKNENFAFLFVF